MKSTATLTVTTPTERELVMTRVFDAPRRLVFDALTRPELLKRWYLPRGWSWMVCEVDLRVGGAWRFVTRQPEGKEIGQRGVYREIVPPERLVNTESWEDWNAGELLITAALVEQGAKTTLTRPCSSHPRRFGTLSSSPAWRGEPARPTTSSPNTWHRSADAR